MTLRQQIRAIVDRAHAAGKPITWRVIWGLLDEDIDEKVVGVEISNMVKRGELTLLNHHYGPGENTPSARSFGTWRSSLLGFKQMARLIDAREQARQWEGAGA